MENTLINTMTMFLRKVQWFALFVLGIQGLGAEEKPNIVFILTDDMPWYGTSVQVDNQHAFSHKEKIGQVN